MGIVVCLACWQLQLSADGLEWSLLNIRQIHSTTPPLMVLGLFPSVSGLIAVHLLRSARFARHDRHVIAQLEAQARELLVPELIVENTMDGIISVNRKGRITHINPAAERMFGYALREAKDMAIAQLIPDYGADDNAGVRRRTSRDVELGTEWHLEGRHKDGITFPIELTFYEGTGPKKGIYVYAVRDPQGQVGRLRRANRMLKQSRERAMAEVRAKDRFVARVSYELRSPLNVVQGYTDMLCEDAEELGITNITGDLERIRRSCEAMHAVITSVLDLNQLTSDTWQPLPEHLPVRPIVDDLSLAVRRRAQKNRNNVHVEVDDDVKTVFADSVLLRQVLLELLDNACRFTESGHVMLAVQLNTGSEGTWVRFHVRDTGIGMTSEDAEKALAGEVTRKLGRFSSKGPVVTLALARRIARAMGGDLTGRGERGKGTLMTLSLPQDDPSAEMDE